MSEQIELLASVDLASVKTLFDDFAYLLDAYESLVNLIDPLQHCDTGEPLACYRVLLVQLNARYQSLLVEADNQGFLS